MTCHITASSGFAQALPDADSEPPEPQAIETLPDSLLAGRLQAIFSNVPEFTDVTAAVTEGVVRLRGSVDQPEDRRAAEDLTSSLEGVVYVVNDVEISTDVETRVAPAFAQVREYLNAFVSELPVVGVAVLVLLLFLLASIFVGRWSRPPTWTGVNPLVWGFLRRLIRGIFVLVGLVLAFDILGITSLMGAVLGTAGIVGLALGFAFQDIVENYLAGMLLSLRRPFSINDYVEIGEYEGRVVRLTSRELVMMTPEGNHVRLPNAHVFKNPFTNFTINPRRLFSFDIGIAVPEDLQKAMSVGTGALNSMTGVLHDPRPFAYVIEVGEATVTVRYHGWVDQREADFLKVRSEAIRHVKDALDQASIELPEGTYRVLLEAASEQKSAAERAERPGTGKQEEEVDIRPDGKLDEQVREDLERSDDQNLLE